MQRNRFLHYGVGMMLIAAVITIPFTLSVSGQASTTTEVFFSDEVYIIPAAKQGICYYALTMVPVTASDTLSGILSSDNSGGVAFAIMTTDQYTGFLDPSLNPSAGSHSGVSAFYRHTCVASILGADYHREGQSIQFQWTASTSNSIWLIILNGNSDTTAVTMSLDRVSTGGGMGYSRTSSTNSLTSFMATYSSETGSPAGFGTSSSSQTSFLPLPADPTYLFVGLGVVVLAALAFWRVRSSGKQPPQATSVDPRSQFCISCGRQIQPGSRFCGKCGAAQT